MTLLSRSFRPLTGTLQSFLKPFGATRSPELYIVRNRPLTESSISSILARAPSATGYDDAHNPRTFPSLVGKGEIRCLTSSAADEIDNFSSCSDDDCERDDETVEATRRKAWLERLNELKEYKMNHGDTLVPQRYPANPSLGNWVNNQRATYTMYQNKKELDEKWSGVEVLDDKVKEEMDRLTRRSSGMNEERIQLLEAEGFVWDPYEAQWFERLNELKDYKMNHGDTLVPSVYPVNPSLGHWVHRQRERYTFYQKRKELDEKWSGVEVLDDEVKEEMDRLTRRIRGMNEERFQLLEAEGFVWDPYEAQWFERLNELKDYKLHHGDTLVPKVYPANPSLGHWVTNQRATYTFYQNKKEFDEKWRGVEVLDDEVKEEMDRLTRGLKGMNEKRIQLLEAEGFVWDVLEAQWFERLNELKDYKMNHGDTLVPRGYPANPSLGLWVRNQRATYTIYRKKKEFEEKWRGVEVLDDEVKEEMDRLTRRIRGMNEERIQLLNAEGFVWDPYEAQWFERLNELKDYKLHHGDTLVPSVYPINPSLGLWVNTQRRTYTFYQKKKEFDEKWRGVEVLDDEVKEEMDRLTRGLRGMNEERMQLLEAEGFVWDVPAHVWESRFQELLAFMALNGHAVIYRRKRGTYGPLAEWASTQRLNYIKRQNGQLTTLTEDRIEKLNSVGFAWGKYEKTRVRRTLCQRVESGKVSSVSLD